MSQDTFSPDAVEAIREHMNTHHESENLLIVRVLGQIPAAFGAQMTGMDADGIEFEATDPSGGHHIRLPWSGHLTDRAEVRAEVVRMYHRAVGATR